MQRAVLDMLWTLASPSCGYAVDSGLSFMWVYCGQCPLLHVGMLWTMACPSCGYAVDSCLSFMWVCCGQWPLLHVDML